VVNRYHPQGDSETSIAIIALALAMIVKKAGDFSMGKASAKDYPLSPEEESGETRSWLLNQPRLGQAAFAAILLLPVPRHPHWKGGAPYYSSREYFLPNYTAHKDMLCEIVMFL